MPFRLLAHEIHWSPVAACGEAVPGWLSDAQSLIRLTSDRKFIQGPVSAAKRKKKYLLSVGRNLMIRAGFLLTVFSSQYYTVCGMQRTLLCVLIKTCSNGRIFHSRISQAYKNDLAWRIGRPNTQITQYNLLFSWCSLVLVLWIKNSVG